MKCLLIMNQSANKGKSTQIHDKIRAEFENTDNTFELKRTKGPDDARIYAYDAVGVFDVIAACGGDGTVNEIVDGMLQRSAELDLAIEDKPRLAIFPIGRGNDFAWMMGITNYDIETIVSNISQNKYRVIDAGWCKGGRFPEGAYFINGLGIGFEPLVNYRAGLYKRISGSLSYILGLFSTLLHYPKAMHLKITYSDGVEEEVHSQQLSIGNGRRMGSSFLMSPEAIVDDGLLDFVYSYIPISRQAILFVATKFFKGKQLEDKHFKMKRVKSLTIESLKKDMVVHIDGEMVGVDLDNIIIKVKQNAIAIIC